MWNCITVKSTDAGRNLNEENRQTFRSPEDERFQFLHDMADKFKDMDVSKSTYKKRVMCMTVDTSNALFTTLKGMIALIKVLLANGFKYVYLVPSRVIDWKVSLVFTGSQLEAAITYRSSK